MKKILLISNEVLHYREKVYNYLYDRFFEDGYELEVLCNKYQRVNYKLDYRILELDFSVKRYINHIKNSKPQFVILFLHLKDSIMFPIIWYCKKHRIPVIFWGIGINTRTQNNKLKNALFHYIHNVCDALITYTPETREYFAQKNQKKLFVAYNTLNFCDINKEKVASKEEIKKKYHINEEKVILFISRMMPYKRVDLLMDLFEDLKDIAVVMVGPGFSDEQKERVQKHDNLYYLGEKYGEEVNEIYKIGDVFSTPGHIGLAMNEAAFWGLPVVLLDGFHAPEIYYMKSGINGYLAKDENDLKRFTIELLRDESRLNKMKGAALRIYNEEISIDKMYQGFIEAIKYCER